MMRRNRTSTSVLEISEAELLRQTKEIDELHQDQSLPLLRSSVQEWIETNNDRRPEHREAGAISRRTLLLGAGAAAVGGVVLAACSSSPSTSTTTTSPAAKTTDSLTGDLKVVALAASLENLAIFAYGAGIGAARAAKLGTVPPAVVTFATTAMSQHQQHAAAWNAVLTAAGKKAVTETDPALTPTVKHMFGQVTDVGGLAKLALELENVAAQTYQASVGEVSSTKAIQTAASIQPVEMQHAAILNLVLGNYPVPNAFNPVSSARPTSDLSGR
jgi:hypothetical protein